MNEYIDNRSQKPYGQSECCNLHPHLKQEISDSSPRSFNNTTPTNIALSMNNSNNSRTSTIKRNRRRITSKKSRPTTRSQKARNSSSRHYSLLSDDEERLLEYALDAYIVYKGSQTLMVKSLSQKLNTNVTKMKILCQTLCQLIEVKIQ